jgi:hypothetical protein
VLLIYIVFYDCYKKDSSYPKLSIAGLLNREIKGEIKGKKRERKED